MAVKSEERMIRLYKILDRLAFVDGIRVKNILESITPPISPQQLNDDLNELIERGYITRNQGFVSKVRSTGLTEDATKQFQQTAYLSRLSYRPEEKRAIARKIIEDGRLAGSRTFITSGTSCTAVFESFRDFESDKLPHEIITNHIPGFLLLLKEFSSIPVTMIGGRLITEAAGTAGGGEVKDLGEYTAVLSVSMIDVDRGLYCNDDESLQRLRSTVINSCTYLVIPADHKKLSRIAGGVLCVPPPDWKKTYVYVDLWTDAFRNPDRHLYPDVTKLLQRIGEKDEKAKSDFLRLGKSSSLDCEYYVSELVSLAERLKERLVIVPLDQMEAESQK